MDHGALRNCFRVTPALLAVGGLLPACGLLAPFGIPARLGPDYVEAETASAERWIDYGDRRLDTSSPELAVWWAVLRDPKLNALMARTAASNISLQSAVERVAASRARRDLVAGFQYPQSQQAFGGVSHTELSEKSANTDRGVDTNYKQWDAGIGAVWEFDLWGRYARAVEGADAALGASIAEHDALQVLLFGEVAARYVSYRTLQERLSHLRESVRVQEGNHRIAKDRFEAGAVPERDVFEALQVLEDTRARIPEVERDLRRNANALCVLTGSVPRDLAAELGEEGIPAVPESLVIGIPADLVRRRPDVRRAERLAAARCAEIGIAETDYYPRFSLTGTLGISAEHFSDVDTSDAAASLLGASFTWSLFDWGRTESNVRLQEAEYRAAVLDYQDVVLRAGAEVEDALIGFLKAQETIRARSESARAASRAHEIALDQYNEGLVDFLTIYIFAGTLADQMDLLATARGDAAAALVDVYRSLGGGWTPPPPPPPPPADGPAPSEGEQP